MSRQEIDRPNIYQRLNEVRKAVGYIQKDAKVQGYKAVTHDMVTSEIRGHLIEQGVMVIPQQKVGRAVETGAVTSSGTAIIRYEGWYNVEFVNIDSPDDKVIVPIEAHALDHGDKAPGKCISYATKYAVLKVFSIETGESDESRQDMKPKPLDDGQISELRELCRAHDFPATETLKALAAKVYGVKDINQVPAEAFEDAKKRIEKKAANNAEQPTANA